MANSNNISINITSNKEEYERALEQVAEKVLTEWGMQAASAARELCPVDTGLLRNSITYAVAGRPTAISSYKSSGTHATTEATKKAKTAGTKVNPVKEGRYSGQAQADMGGPRHVYIGSNVEYAPYQEIGTAKMKAQPFLRPAIEQNKDYFKSILEGELKNALQN